jgi:hypothetical protein
VGKSGWLHSVGLHVTPSCGPDTSELLSHGSSIWAFPLPVCTPAHVPRSRHALRFKHPCLHLHLQGLAAALP